MDVSVIIVTYNTLSMTQACIESVIRHTKNVEYEIILVDNASVDGSRVFFYKNEHIKYIYSTENLGFGRANNLGYASATGKYIFLLNSDTLLLNNAIYEFFKYMEQCTDKVGCTGCLLVDKKNKPMHSYGSFQSVSYFLHRIIRFYHPRLCFAMNRPRLWHTYPKYVDYITGADLFIRKSVVDACGLFDPDFFMYYEEAEMQKRYHDAGYQTVVIDTPKIQHLQGASSKHTRNTIAGDIRELVSRYTYLRKTHGFFRRKVISYLHLLLIPALLLKQVPISEKKELIHIVLKNL